MELKMPVSSLIPTVAKIHLKGFSRKILNLKNYAMMLCSSVPLCPSGFLFKSTSLYFWSSFTLHVPLQGSPCTFLALSYYVHLYPIFPQLLLSLLTDPNTKPIIIYFFPYLLTWLKIEIWESAQVTFATTECPWMFIKVVESQYKLNIEKYHKETCSGKFTYWIRPF